MKKGKQDQKQDGKRRSKRKSAPNAEQTGTDSPPLGFKSSPPGRKSLRKPEFVPLGQTPEVRILMVAPIDEK